MSVERDVITPQNEWTERVTRVLTYFIRWFSAHWLALANLAVGLYIGLPVLAPVLMHLGFERLGNLIYLVFRPLCHQLPERSYFLFGSQWVYSYQELAQRLAGAVPQRWVGNPAVGYKIAVCERDVAIYSSMLFCGLLYQFVRAHLRPISFKLFLVLITPMAVDGFGQLFGFWTSTWVSRTITGGLFGLACVLLAYPYIEPGMRDIHTDAERTIAEWRQ